MKKIALLIMAVAVMATASAQVVVGLQGGYHQQKTTNSANADYTSAMNYLGSLRVGYMITPKFYAGVSGGLLGSSSERLVAVDSALYPQNNMYYPIEDHMWTTGQQGWHAEAQMRYEFLKYGNMHFHMLLQGAYRSMGYIQYTESFYWVSFPNAHEYNEPVDPYQDSISTTSWSVSLRPTLTYEFSKHLSAELSLDFLSVGYKSETLSHDAEQVTDANGQKVTRTSTTNTLYAGLNTLMETIQWESPMLRLGFNWTF